MKWYLEKVENLKENTENPRFIKDDKFEKLVQSIKDFPEMLELRPIVVNSDMVVLGGNMRLKACIEAGKKEVPTIKAENLTKEQQEEFIIKDNVGFGSWDWDQLANEWDASEVEAWGLDVWQMPEEVDDSILDDEDLEDEIESMEEDVKKAILIEFEKPDYDNAKEVIKFWRNQDAYVGKMILDYLQSEKSKLSEN